MENRTRFPHLETLIHAAIIALVMVGLYLTSRYNYLLFHTLVELFTIAVGWSLFALAWHTRRWMHNPYLSMLGVAFASAASIDLLHTLAYKGMNLFVGYDANLPTQLWIAARYLQAISMLLAAWLAWTSKQTFRVSKVLVAAYAAVTALLVALIFLRIFPTCYIEGMGLTPFKRVSEYVISLILLASLGLLWRGRAQFDPATLRLLTAATIATIFSELAFTFYVGVYDLSNLVGHYGKLLAFYLIYLALIRDGLERPYETLYRDLSRREQLYHQMFNEHPAIQWLLDPNTGEIVQANPAAARFYGYPLEMLQGMNVAQINLLPPDRLRAVMETVRRRECNHFIFQHRLASGAVRDVEVHSAPIQFGERELLYSIIHDITARKAAEEALLRSQTLLNMTGQMARVGGWELDATTLEVMWTKQTYHIHEVPLDHTPPLEEAINFYHPEDRATLKEALQRALDHGEPFDLELRFITATGKELWVHAIGQPMIVNGKTVKVTGSFQDITARRQLEDTLRASEERYRSLFENNHAAMLLIDPTDGAIVDANPAAARYYGWTRDELRQKKIGQINTLPPEEVQAEMARARREERNHFIFRHRLADGSIRDVEVYSGPISMHGHTLLYSIIHDITERRLLEDQLRKTTQTLQALIEAAPVAILILDTEGIVQLWNPQAEAIFGWSAEEVIGHPNPIIPLEETESTTAGLRCQRRDGTFVDVSLSTAPLFGAEGQRVGTVGILADITAQKAAEEQIRRDAQAKALLLNEINHRVGNNLTLLLILLGRDLERAREPETRAVLLDLLGHVQSMADVHRLLQSGQWGPVELSTLAEEIVINMLAGTSAHGRVQVRVDSPPEPLWVGSKQAFKLGLLFNELTTNAIKYAFGEAAQGRIDMRVAPVGPSRARLEFRDNGPGWPAEILSGQREGTGLKLIKLWVEQEMNGQVELYNDDGAALACTITLDLGS